jgi:hypothetical protein
MANCWSGRSTFTDTVLTGPIAGLTQLVEVPDASAFIGEGARTIISAASAPIVQQGAKQRRGHGRAPKHWLAVGGEIDRNPGPEGYGPRAAADPHPLPRRPMP